MVNYNDGKIYKIIDNTNGNIYIGSTCQKYLSQRLSLHIRDYKQFLNGKKNFITSFKIIENNDYYIELIELFSCSCRDELQAREGYHIRNNECVNMRIVGRTKKEYYEDNKEAIIEQNKSYREANREAIKEQRKSYREDNGDKIRERAKTYSEANRDKLREKSKIYCEANRDKIRERAKTYREANRDKLREKSKIYYEKQKSKNLDITVL